ncbi:MAG: sigma-70 family RNA polymerase sigma factor [Armatimonadetes bacterium]|nr:sigma-70 family RNA polymerase sigma factor [Armatimonadota bacterium]
MGTGEERLLKRIAAGESPAMRDLHETYADRLFRYALLRTRDRQLAEDVVQETMLAAWRSASAYRGASSVSTWLFGICRHKVADALRRCPQAETRPLPEAVAGDASAIEFWETFDHLQPDDRELLLLVFHYGFSQREIGQIMDVPVGTVKSRTFYARRRLQALLQGRS